LAAGIGKRMYSKTPKILHTLLGKPVISFVVDLAQDLQSSEIILVLGKNAQAVRQKIHTRVMYVTQESPCGTGDAAKRGIGASSYRNVLILCGDVPFLTKNTLVRLIDCHTKTHADMTILTCEVKNPYGYGRIVRTKNNEISDIVEQADATLKQQKIKEINAGVYYGKKAVIASALENIDARNRQGEYYLTDVVKKIIQRKKKVAGLAIKDEQEILGINSKLDLAHAREILKKRWYTELLSRGVYIEDPTTTTIDVSVKIGRFVHIRPYTIIEGNTTLHDREVVEPFTWIKDGKKITFQQRH
jgi:bifunctional UDP-N-acetylglucosamine pyrophosphorylase/glucosamine-1-phosphate N-acetyltransferase